jgi:hypothetical protein
MYHLQQPALYKVLMLNFFSLPHYLCSETKKVFDFGFSFVPVAETQCLLEMCVFFGFFLVLFKFQFPSPLSPLFPSPLQAFDLCSISPSIG